MGDCEVVRVATFNLLHGESPADGRVDLGRLVDAIGDLDADLLALQEVDCGQPRSGGADQTAVAADAMGATWSRFVPTLTGVPHRWRGEIGPGQETPQFGIALLSRYPVISSRVVPLPAAPGWVRWPAPGRVLRFARDQPRAAILARVQTPGGPLSVVATHLSPLPGSNLRQLQILLREVAQLPRPLVMLGDMNMPGGIPSKLTGLRPAARAVTFPAQAPLLQYDHVLVDGDLAVVEPAEARRLPVSDHRAMRVGLETTQVPSELLMSAGQLQSRSTVLR